MILLIKSLTLLLCGSFWRALLSDQVDGAVYTEPQASMLAAQGAIVLGSSKEAGIKGGTLQFMTDVVKDRPQRCCRILSSLRSSHRLYEQPQSF